MVARTLTVALGLIFCCSAAAAADPDAAIGALQLQDRERLRRADDRVPHLER